MPPKGKAGAKAAAKAKTKAKAIKDKEEVVEEISSAKRAKKAGEETALAAKERRGTTSAMLGFLKWNSNPLSDNRSFAQECSKTLETYKTLPNEKKREFVAAYDKAKDEGKHKDLDFAKSFLEVAQSSTSTSVAFKDDVLFIHESLALNGFDANHMDEEKKQRIAIALIKDSEAEHQYETDRNDHSSGEPELIKYRCIFKGAKETKQEDLQKSSLVLNRDLNQKMIQGMASDAEGAIKLEHPEFQAMLKNCKDLSACKGGLQKLLNSALDLEQTASAMVKASKMQQDVLDVFAGGCNALTRFVSDIRETVSVAQLLDESTTPEGLLAMTDNLKKLFAMAKEHDTGIKTILKGMKAKCQA